MVDSPTARLSSARSLMNFEKVSSNLVNLRGDLNRERIDRQKFEEKRGKLLKREERSLSGLRAATMNLRKIIGGVAGASALSRFSQGDIGGGIQDTGVAIAAFLPEIIGITSNIVVGGLATKGLLGGGVGMAGAPKGKAGLMALPLLALAPLLMGAGRNNQSNAPTSEFRREQEIRRTRKNIINSGDTDRFSSQLDRFEKILDNLGGSPRQRQNINQEISSEGISLDVKGNFVDNSNKDVVDEERDEDGRDGDGRKPILNQIADFLSLANPFLQVENLFKSEEVIRQENQDRFAIFGTMFDFIKNIFTPAEAKAGTLDEFMKDGGVLPNTSGNQKINVDKISNIFGMGDDNVLDFKSVLGSKKNDEMENIMINFLGSIDKDLYKMKEEDRLESIASTFNGSIKSPIITKTFLEDAPEFVENIFIPMIGEGIPNFEDTGAITEETGNAVTEPDVDPEFKGSVDKFVNRLLLNINR